MKPDARQIAFYISIVLLLLIPIGMMVTSPLAYIQKTLEEIMARSHSRATLPPPVVGLSGETTGSGSGGHSRPVMLPSELASPKVLTEPLVQTYRLAVNSYQMLSAAEKLGEAEEVDYLKILLSGARLGSRERGAVDAELKGADGFLKTLGQTAKTDDYNPEYLRDPRVIGADGSEGVAPRMVSEGVKLLCLKALTSKEMDSDEAMQLVATAARVARTLPASRLDMQGVQTEGLRTAVDSWARLVADEKDPAVLSRTLQDMNVIALSLQSRIGQVKSPVARDILARIQNMDAADVPSLLEDASPQYLLEKYATAREQEAARKFQAIPASDPRRQKMQERVNKELEELKGMVPDAGKAQGGADGTAAQDLSAQDAPEKASQAALDVLRLETAAKIASTEDNGREPTPESLTPRFMAVAPQDPFTAKDYGSVPQTGERYSVGPDGKDDGGAIPYDPTNGALSAGDVLVPLSAPSASAK